MVQVTRTDLRHLVRFVAYYWQGNSYGFIGDRPNETQCMVDPKGILFAGPYSFFAIDVK
jgi:hypothetical protein